MRIVPALESADEAAEKDGAPSFHGVIPVYECWVRG
jgi:hypothetical protein